MREISVDTQHQYNDMYKKGRYWGQITISRYMSLISGLGPIEYVNAEDVEVVATGHISGTF